VIFYLPFEGSEHVFRQMLDIINNIRPSSIAPKNFVKCHKFPANPPISAKFQNIPNAMQILQQELARSVNIFLFEILNVLRILAEKYFGDMGF